MADASNAISAEHGFADVWRAAQRRRGEFFAAFLQTIFYFKAYQRIRQSRVATDDASGAVHLRDAA